MNGKITTKKCAIKREMYTLFDYVYSEKVKDLNEKLRERIEGLEQDLINEMDTEEILDKKLKKLADKIVALTAEYRVMELRTDKFPMLQKTLKMCSEELVCRQGPLVTKEGKGAQLEITLKESLHFNTMIMKQRNLKRVYVTTACETLKECASLIRKAVQTKTCTDLLEQKSSCWNSTTFQSMFTNSYKNEEALEMTESHETQTSTFTNVHENSETLSVQFNLLNSCKYRETFRKNAPTNFCEDAKALVHTVLMKLRRLLPVSGDPGASLIYLMKNADTTDLKYLDNFSILDLRIYQNS